MGLESSKPSQAAGDATRGKQAGDLTRSRPDERAGTRADSWPLLGHAEELRAIADSLAGQPRGVVISGPPGSGKTRLAREALAAAQRTGRRTHWVAGTGATAAIPLGAVAHLIPSAETGASPLALVKRAVQALTSQPHGDLIVGVDDAHLLDELSLAFVNRLALTGEVPLVLTVRSSEPVPDAVRALWKDGLADRLQLRPLPSQTLDRLVRTVLGGLVDSRTCERLCRACQGNLVFLRELVDGGLADGRLASRNGVWRWEGAMTPTPRLTEIIRAEMGRLGATDRAALELLALYQPAELGLLLRLASPETLTSLERRGLLAVEGTGRRAQVRLAHPLYTAAVREQIPEAAAPGLRRRITEALAPWPAVDVRLARLVLDNDGPLPPAGTLADASVRANAEQEHELAERLARAAVEARAGLPARAALVEALHWQGRAEEAEYIAAAAAPRSLAATDRSGLAIVRALNLFFGLGRPDEAESTLLAAEAVLARLQERNGVRAVRGVLAFFGGRPQEAVELGREVQASAASPASRAWASVAAAAGLAVTGQTGEALAAVADGWAALAGSPAVTGTAFIRAALGITECLALLLGGRISAAATRATQLHEANLSQPPSARDAVTSLQLGWTALAAGRLGDAIRWLTEAEAALRQRDPVGLLPLCTAKLVQASALAGTTLPGRGPPAAAHLIRHGAVTVFEPEILIAESLLSADGHLAEAVERAHQAAAAAAASGQWGVQSQALHVIVRLGQAGQVTDRLRQLADHADGPLAATFAAHAEAAAGNAAERLDEVAADFEALGALLRAAESAAQAAAAHELTGDRPRRAASAARAARLARICGTTGTLALRQLTARALTSREQEVASLAGLGLSNRAIAGQLVVSVHTVETHLARSYSKLGITRRRELPEALERAIPVAGEAGLRDIAG